MSAQDEYLFDPSAQPDLAVAELEDALRPLAEAPPMPLLPPRGADPRIVHERNEVMNVSALDQLPANRNSGPTVALVIGAFVAGVAATLAGVALMRPAATMGPAPTPTPAEAPVAGVEQETEPEAVNVPPPPDPTVAEPAAKWKQRLGIKADGQWDAATIAVVDGAFREDQFPSDVMELRAFSKQTISQEGFGRGVATGGSEAKMEYSPGLDPGEYTVCAALWKLGVSSSLGATNTEVMLHHECSVLVVAADGTLSTSHLELHGPEPRLEAKPSGKKGHPGDLKDPFKKKRPQKPINSPDLTDPFKK